ncbi:MAG: hypothetical protein GXC94_03145 [Comamonadaceae bacterium]|jgi:hypothetical protein|nr:hypothetical protein [Comamonadaceae bacterium]
MNRFTKMRWALLAGLSATGLTMLPTTTLAAPGGSMLEFDQRVGARSERLRLAVSPTHVAVLNEAGQTTLLYQRASRLLVLIDHGGRSYRQLDRPHLERLAEEVNAAMRQTRARIDALPPAERAQAERALADLLGGPPAPAGETLSFGAAAQRGRAAGIECRWYDMQVGGKATGRVCAAEPRRVPGGEGVLELLGAMAEAYGQLSRLTAAQLPAALRGNPLLPMVKLGQLPLLMQQQRGAGESSESRLLSVSEAPIAASVFTIPAGFRDAFAAT